MEELGTKSFVVDGFVWQYEKGGDVAMVPWPQGENGREA